MHGILAIGAVVATAALAAAGCGPEYPSCDNDEDCHEGEFCVNGLCQQCRSDGDCPTGQACQQGACQPIPGFCQSTGDCPAGQECRDNRCIAAAQSRTDVPEPPPQAEPCDLSPVYFGFDEDSLDGSARNTIQSNVECMRSRGIDGVHLTGHTDPRGTEEYNLALGDRRARAVMEYMISLGVDPGSLASSSMGEEMATGTDEGGWAHDRKVTFNAR